ncbi:HAMP domain-containing histidine kinase [Candidatus Saccharibacteria bacterium]|nr:HAMP domain-containing histidine kinase [Candidatus Saccharibacteria bacterium]
MVTSVLFSIIIFQVASNEVHQRVEHIQNSINAANGPGFKSRSFPIDPAVSVEMDRLSMSNLSAQLFYMNLSLLLIGGFGCYYLARRSLRPIEKAHARQSRFTSDASHELRTPLAVMRTELEVALRDTQATKAGYREVLQSNLEEVNKLTKLSEMLLVMSQLENNDIKMSNFNLNKTLKNTLLEFDKKFDRFSVKYNKKVTAHGNEEAISDLIKILIENALQYGTQGSNITIYTSATKDQAHLTVKNDGAGIEADKLPFIFDRFFRADSSRTGGTKKGYGLGLALAKTIVNLHGGEIVATSEPGKETSFEVILPSNDSSQAKFKNNPID